MITDLESRLATVLGARLPAPFTGRVTASPAGSPGQEPRIVVATRAADPMQTTLHSQRREVVPGDPAPRRVLRLACELELAVQPAANAGRAQQLQGVDALIHTLDDPEFPAALSGPADPGFLLDTFALGGTQLPAEPAAVTVSVRAAGLFWPVGAPGEMGPQVDTVTLRDASLQVELILPAQPIRATGSAAVIGVRFPSAGALEIDAQGARAVPFGRLVARLRSPDGSAGKGTLGGGGAGPAGTRLLDVVDGTAELTYTPPDEPGADLLEIGFDAADRVGRPHARTTLEVLAP